jgi:hypothetical protein
MRSSESTAWHVAGEPDWRVYYWRGAGVLYATATSGSDLAITDYHRAVRGNDHVFNVFVEIFSQLQVGNYLWAITSVMVHVFGSLLMTALGFFVINML